MPDKTRELTYPEALENGLGKMAYLNAPVDPPRYPGPPHGPWLPPSLNLATQSPVEERAGE